MIDLQLDGVARTLAMTLRARAEEHQRDNGLFNDAWSADWLRFMPNIPQLDRWYNPVFQLASVIRTHIIDTMVVDFLERQTSDTQKALVVELGSGLSTRYYRLARGRTEWVEVDLPQAIAVRRKIDADSDEHWFYGANLEESNWVDALPAFEPEHTLFIAEGVLMFLDPNGVSSLVGTLRRHYSGAEFIFDVVREAQRERMNDTAFDKMDARMQWGANEDELKALGLLNLQTEYLLLNQEARWREIGIEDDKRTAERSGYVVHTRLHDAK